MSGLSAASTPAARAPSAAKPVAGPAAVLPAKIARVTPTLPAPAPSTSGSRSSQRRARAGAVATLELEAKTQVQHAAQTVQNTTSANVLRLQGILEQLTQVEPETVVHQLLLPLPGAREHPDQAHSLHGSALQPQGQPTARSPKVAAPAAAPLSSRTAAALDSARMKEVQVQVASLSAEASHLLDQLKVQQAQLSRMQADPAFQFTTNDPLAACRWHTLLHTRTRVLELEEAVVKRELLITKLKDDPGCTCSLNDPCLEYRARQVLKARHELDKQVKEAVTTVSCLSMASLPAAMALFAMVLAMTA